MTADEIRLAAQAVHRIAQGRKAQSQNPAVIARFDRAPEMLASIRASISEAFEGARILYALAVLSERLPDLVEELDANLLPLPTERGEA